MISFLDDLKDARKEIDETIEILERLERKQSLFLEEINKLGLTKEQKTAIEKLIFSEE